MKILQVNCVYNKGSTGKIAADIHTELRKQGIESVVCYGRGERIKEPHVYKTCGELYSRFNNLLTRFTGVMYGGCYFSTNRLISIIRREKPDVVHVHCINGYFVNIYRLITWLKKNRIRTVLTLHAEFMHTANCGHALDCERWKTGCGKCPRLRQETKSLFIDNTAHSWKRMKKAFDGFDGLVVASVSPWLMERAELSPILSAHEHTVVTNGVDTSVFHVHDTKDLRNKLGLTDEKLVFHATTYFTPDPAHIKGGCYVLRLAERMKDENVKFIVAGRYEPSIKVPDNVILLGEITDQHELAAYYSMADVTLLTSRRETFSMVTAESLCCGTPVAGFKAGGPESIAMTEYSKFAEYGDIDALTWMIRYYLDAPVVKTEVSEKAVSRYGSSLMCEEYLKIYRKILQKQDSYEYQHQSQT